MNNQARGEELNQLSRLLFDSAANKWYFAAILEIVAGVLAAVLSVKEPSGDQALVGAFVGVGLIGLAYLLRLWFEAQYDAAETMRRQAALTEGLGWEISSLQTSDWLQKAGNRVRKRLKVKVRDADYYASKAAPSAARLGEMTTESAFYTRQLYTKLHVSLWVLFTLAVILTIVSLSIALTQTVPDTIDILVAKAIYAIIPVVLSINFLGWALRLGRSIDAIREVEEDLDRLQASPNWDEGQIMRLVTEYNCQVVGGFPIHPWLFWLWGDEIKELWQRRSAR